MKSEMRQKLAHERFEEKIRKVGQLVQLVKTFPRRSQSLLPSNLGPMRPTDMRYELIIYWSKADESFVVEVPELPGCMADGATYGEAVANAQTVIEERIETAKSFGHPIPKPRGKPSHSQ